MKARQMNAALALMIVGMLSVAQSAFAQSGQTDPYDAAGKVGALIGGILGAFFLVRSFRKKNREPKPAVPCTPPPPTTPEKTEPPSKKCPNCGTRYRRDDYRKDAPEWLCSACKKLLPKE